MNVKQIEEAARQEGIRRGYGPRMLDWFCRGAYAAGQGSTANAPTRRPTRAWFLDGVRWYDAETHAAARREAAEMALATTN